MDKGSNYEQVMRGLEVFFNRNPIITLTLTVILLSILFLGSIEAGQHIGDAFWG